MQYEGKIYGKIGKKVFDTGKTSDDWDRMEKIVSAAKHARAEQTKKSFEKLWRVVDEDQNLKEYVPTFLTDFSNFGLLSIEEETNHKKIETYKLPEDFTLRVHFENGRVFHTEIRKKNEYVAYYIKDGENFRNQCKNKYFYSECPKKNYWWHEYIIEDAKQILENFNVENIFIIKTDDHTFRDRNEKHLDQLIHLDYIAGFREKDLYRKYDFKKVKKHLKSHPNILNLKEIEIPYYNRDFSGQKGLDMDILFLSGWRLDDNQYHSEESLIFGESDPLGISKFKLD